MIMGAGYAFEKGDPSLETTNGSSLRISNSVQFAQYAWGAITVSIRQDHHPWEAPYEPKSYAGRVGRNGTCHEPGQSRLGARTQACVPHRINLSWGDAFRSTYDSRWHSGGARRADGRMVCLRWS